MKFQQDSADITTKVVSTHFRHQCGWQCREHHSRTVSNWDLYRYRDVSDCLSYRLYHTNTHSQTYSHTVHKTYMPRMFSYRQTLMLQLQKLTEATVPKCCIGIQHESQNLYSQSREPHLVMHKCIPACAGVDGCISNLCLHAFRIIT